MAINSNARVVHLELHTRGLAQAREIYAELCGWRAEHIQVANGSYTSLELGGGLGGGLVECASARAVWLPYVEVSSVAETTERARSLGAAVLLEPREGRFGSRSVVATPAGGELAFWEPRHALVNGNGSARGRR